MTDVAYSSLILNGATPYLTPAADFATLDARSKTDLITGARCRVLDEDATYQYNGANWVDPNGLTWVSLTSNADWTSNAFIAKIQNGKFAILRGNFVSNADGNNGAPFDYPTGYLPLNNIARYPVATSRGGNSYTLYNGVTTWSGSGSTLDLVQAGVVDGDHVQASVNNSGTGGPPLLLQESRPLTNLGGPNAGSSGIRFRLSGSNANNDVVISWEVKKSQARALDSLVGNSSNNSLDTGATYGSSDVIYVDGIVYALSGS